MYAPSSVNCNAFSKSSFRVSGVFETPTTPTQVFLLVPFFFSQQAKVATTGKSFYTLRDIFFSTRSLRLETLQSLLRINRDVTDGMSSTSQARQMYLIPSFVALFSSDCNLLGNVLGKGITSENGSLSLRASTFSSPYSSISALTQ